MAVHTVFSSLLVLLLLAVSGCSHRFGAGASDGTAASENKRISSAAAQFEQKRNQIQFQAARSRWQQGDADGCVQSLKQVLSRDPNHAEATALLHRVSQGKMSQGQASHVELASYEVAASNGEIASTLPDVANSSLAHAKKALASAESAVASQHLEGYVRAEGTTQQAAISAALLPLRFEQPRLALQIAESVRQRFGDSAELFRVIGTAHYRHGDYQSSKGALQQSLSLDSTDALTYLLQSFALEKLGEREAAVQSRQRAHQLGL